MDEQAGPGVFFNNNNNSILAGVGKVLLPEGDAGEADRSPYSIPGILHFLQHEWARFEVDRAQWEVDRAELQAQTAFLQGERKGQENLKKDLVRRIKMLEYVLKQERYVTEPDDHLWVSLGGWGQGEWEGGDRVSGRGDRGGQGEKKPPSSSSPALNMDTSEDPDAEDALKGFDFLSSPDNMDTSPESRSAADGTDWEKEEQSAMSEAWDVDQGLITKLKEEYRKERKGKKGERVRPNRSKLQDMLANLRDQEDMSPREPSSPQARSNAPRLNEQHQDNRSDEVEVLTFPPSSGKSFIMGPDENMEAELGLGELAGLTVANEADSLAYDMSNNKDALRRTWNPKLTLRSHFDGVRGLAFHPIEPVLVTASEDHTLKMWNLQKTAPAKKNASVDVEPMYTFRAHQGAVLCVVMSSTGEQCFSGGLDGTIQSWNTPNPNLDPYDSYEPSVLRGALCGHTDSVWGLVYSGVHRRLLSCSGDGTVKLWDASDTKPALVTFQNKEFGVPSSVDLLCSDPAHMVTSFTSGRIGLFNMETQQLVLSLESAAETGTRCQINKVLSHPTLPITITAEEDRHIKFFDNNTGKLIHSMVAHLDAVTSLAVDPNGLYLMSGSHDCSIRLWNLETKTCIQEFTAHRKKNDESIHDVAFHPSKAYIASAGADALAKVFV
uniref:Striatin N-terminal domain-containing protein n=1 Tax=Oncorhynchus tshawytscha TaxID=74940 RepID=A0AAZ3RWJ2_ONCTS